MADKYAPLSQQIFNVSMAQIEPMIEPNSVLNYYWRKSMAFVQDA